MTHVKGKKEEFTESFNTMVDAHAAHTEDISWLKNKAAGMEDTMGQH